MKTEIILFFHAGLGRPWEGIKAMIERAGRYGLFEGGQPPAPFFRGRFSEEDPSLHLLKDELQKTGISWHERKEFIYTEAELRAAPLLSFFVRRAPVGEPGDGLDREYDLSAGCRKCGAGAKQISPVRLRASDLPRSGGIRQTLLFETLISEALASIFRDEAITGLEYGGIVTPRDGRRLPWKQMVATQSLPPMHPSSKGFHRALVCAECRRNGFFDSLNEPRQIFYQSGKVDLENTPDVVHTWEHFGCSHLRAPVEKSRFAKPLFLIKPRVFDIIRKHKVRGLEFSPVTILHD